MSTAASADMAPRAERSAAIRGAPVILAPCTRVTTSWGMAGGLVAGGILVAAVTLGGRISSSSIPVVSTVLFALGGAAGLVHGSLLGWLAHGQSHPPREVARWFGTALLLFIPGGVAAWIASLWIGLTAASLQIERPMVIGGVVLGWAVGLAMTGWAIVEGVGSLRTIFRRRPRHRWAALAASGVFGLLVAAFHVLRPSIPFTDIRVAGFGGVLVALVASIWIALPVAVMALELLGRAGRKTET